MPALGELEGGGEAGEGSGNELGAGETGAELSDWNDCDLPPMGIVRFLRADSLLFLSEAIRFISRYSSSGGTSSAGGIGMPLAAAMS